MSTDILTHSFGIELETIATQPSLDAGLVVGGYHAPRQVCYLPDGWRSQSDSSIRAERIQGGVDCEIISPILRGEAGLRQVAEVVKVLREKGHKVNASCGVHVHVGWNPTLNSSRLSRLVTSVANNEEGIYASTGTHSRQNGNYCRPVKQYGDFDCAKRHLDCGRYFVLNLSNLATGRQDTVEFRAFSASLNAVKIVGWIMLSLGLVEKALNGAKMPKWNKNGGKSKRLAGFGAGRKGLELLFAFLNWANVNRKQQPHKYGWLLPGDELRDEVLAEFRRLSSKFDSEVRQPVVGDDGFDARD